MELKDMNPFVRQAISALLTQSTTTDVSIELQTPDCRLFYIVSGAGKMIIQNNTYDLVKGCAIFFQAGTKYMWQVDCSEGIQYIAINFDFTHNFSYIKSSFHPVHSSYFLKSDVLEHIDFTDCPKLSEPIYIKNATVLESRLKLLTTQFFIGDVYCDELLAATLKSVLIHMVRLSNSQNAVFGNKGFLLTQEIIKYIQKNYHQEITYETLADSFHFHSSHINRVFKKNTGKSLHSFLLEYRMNIAMETLRSGIVPVNEVAIMVGYTDIPHFIKTFKKFTGMTPSKYRNSNT